MYSLSYKDIIYTTTSFSIDYVIKLVTDVETPIFRGHAVKGPMKPVIEINVSNIIGNYIRNNFYNVSQITGETLFSEVDAYRFFKLYGISEQYDYEQETSYTVETLLDYYQVLVGYDYYDNWEGEAKALTTIINGHIDPRMKLFYSLYGHSGDTINIDHGYKDFEFSYSGSNVFEFYEETRTYQYTSTNSEEIQFGTDEDWFTITKNSTSAFTITVLENEGMSERTGYYYIAYPSADYSSMDYKYYRIIQNSFENAYFTTRALSAGTIALSAWTVNSEPINYVDVSYQLNDGEWIDTNTRRRIEIRVNAGDVIRWKSVGDDGFYSRISSTTYYEVYGNIASLQYGDDYQGKQSGRLIPFLFYAQRYLINAKGLILGSGELSYDPDYLQDIGGCGCYEGMFMNCTALLSAPYLPSVYLSTKSYAEMFRGCTSLVNAPVLPATYMANSCYDGMFWGCTSITTAPELNSTELAEECYSNMFSNCTSLVNAPELPSTTLAKGCYAGMFNSCTSLVNAPALNASELEERCYAFMFDGCYSIITAPNLPATVVKQYSYYGMFRGCTSLVNAPIISATTLDTYCYQEMFAGCTSLVTAPALISTTLDTYCYQDMFSGCTQLQNAPELPSTALSAYCYYGMFRGCTSLVNAPALPALSLQGGCYDSMFEGCTRITTAPDLLASTLTNYCYNNMFKNCSRLKYIKCLASYKSATGCLTSWVSGVASSGTFVKRTGTTWTTGVNGIPSGWSVQSASA